MTPNEYVKLALVTESDNFSNTSLVGRLSLRLFEYFHKGTIAVRMAKKRSIRLTHAYIGVATELEELLNALDNPGQLDKVNVMEEVADCLWYCAIASDELKLDLNKMLGGLKPLTLSHSEEGSRNRIEANVRESIKASGRLLDLIKKGTFYGKTLNEEDIRINMTALVGHVSEICQLSGFSLEEAMKRNIAKLAKRYAGKFSGYFAVNRNLELEREILEGDS